jgi:hypothetical protein
MMTPDRGIVPGPAALGRGGRTAFGFGGCGSGVGRWLLISQKISRSKVSREASRNAATRAVIGSDHKSMLVSVGSTRTLS